MAIFSKKTDEATDKSVDKPVEEQATPVEAGQAAAPAATEDEGAAVVIGGRGNRSLVFPRLSEKASALARLNKYVFKVEGSVNKVELRKALEKAYGIKIARINMVSMRGKTRRYGRTLGRMSDFKKAIVTLTPESKKINLIES